MAGAPRKVSGIMVRKKLNPISKQAIQPTAHSDIRLPAESIDLSQPSEPHPHQTVKMQSAQGHQNPTIRKLRREVIKSSSHLTPASVPVTRAQSSSPTRPPRQSRPRQSSWDWSIIWIALISFFGATGAIAFQWLTQLPPAPNCEQISPLASDSERLYCAQQAAEVGDEDSLANGINLIKEWSNQHPLYDEAQELMSDWSVTLLRVARSKTDQESLTEAISIVNQIPESSPLYSEAQAEVAQWKQEWQTGKAIYDKAIAAIHSKDWPQASEQITALGQIQFDYWSQERSETLTWQILNEKQAWQDLDQADTLAKEKNPDQLVEAIALVRQINPQTDAWKQAEPRLKEWSNRVANASLEALQRGNTQAAMTLAQHVPPDPTFAPNAFDLIQFSHSKTLASTTESAWEPTLQQVWNLFQALEIAHHIEPTSQFYSQAQTQSQTWQAHLQDLIQLQFATWIAGFNQEFALHAAIEQANMVGADRPRRLQAQTLAAHWGQEIQRIQDRPLLASARRLAEPGTIDDLQAAIQQAQQIGPNRALRPDAETAIAQWTAQIQTIEDQPILDEARQLAEAGDLAKAIAQARKINEGRALYDDAQAAIQDWQDQIQLARDRSLLDEASALAARNRLTNAINLASQISPGRALYDEAQAAIAQWSARRAEIWSDWEADESRPSAPSYNEPSYSEPAQSGAPADPSPENPYDGYYDSRYYDDYYGY
ncbi:MAG TPA: hypothetical protein ACFE0H_14855 [Elainellaceae cyanobacterium]